MPPNYGSGLGAAVSNGGILVCGGKENQWDKNNPYKGGKVVKKFDLLLQYLLRFPIHIRGRFKVIYTKYSKHSPYTVAHTIECVCSKINHGLNHELFISPLKLIICPIH